jgi:hypothetical protein
MDEKLHNPFSGLYVEEEDVEVPLLGVRELPSGKLVAKVKLQDVAKVLLRGLGCPAKRNFAFTVTDGTMVSCTIRRYRPRGVEAAASAVARQAYERFKNRR